MSRTQWESQLLRLRFEVGSEEVDDAFDDLLRQKIDDDKIIDRLFADFQDTLLHACVFAAKTIEEEDLATRGELTNRGAVWEHLCEVRTYRSEVRSMEDDQLATTYREQWRANALLQNAQRDLRGRKADLFDFFNEPSADADFAFWLQLAVWTKDEAVALSLGKSPDVVRPDTLFREGDRMSPFRNEYRERTFLIDRAIQAGDLYVPLKQKEIINWFVTHDIDIPPELANDTQKFGIEYWRHRCLTLEELLIEKKALDAAQTSEPKSKLRTSTLYKVVLGIAICAYGHRLLGESPASLAIEEDLKTLQDQSEGELSNITVGDDKIRELLEEAGNYLHASWQGDLDLRNFKAWTRKNRGKAQTRN